MPRFKHTNVSRRNILLGLDATAGTRAFVVDPLRLEVTGHPIEISLTGQRDCPARALGQRQVARHPGLDRARRPARIDAQDSGCALAANPGEIVSLRSRREARAVESDQR